MRIEDDIRRDSSLGKGQIFCWIEATHHTFLTAPAGKLVSDHGVPLKQIHLASNTKTNNFV